MTFVQASGQRKWLGLILVGLLLSLTACSNATPTPIPAAAGPTLPPTQPAQDITVPPTQPQTTVRPGITPAITPAAVSTVICQPSDLTSVPNWSVEQDKFGDYSLKAEVKITNNSSQTCTLPPFSKGQFFDTNGQVVTTSLYAGNIRITALSLSPNDPSTQLPSKQTYTTFITISLINKCGKPVRPAEQGKAGFNLRLTFGTSTALVIPGLKMDHVEQAKEDLFDCIGPVTLTPLEALAGTYFTALANSQRATASAYKATSSTNWNATLTATPPTPTPTAIPTIVPGTKPCLVEQLTIKSSFGSGIPYMMFATRLLTNISSTACTLKGFPVYQVVDSAGNILPGYEYEKEAYAVTPNPVEDIKIPLTPTDAIAPLLNLPPGHIAIVEEKIQDCYWSKDYLPSLDGTLEMVLPDNGGKISLGPNRGCIFPRSTISYFEYVPGY